jgi:hypothetical protein
LWYIGCVTETITIRLRRPKAELQAKAKPNINAWVNGLIDQALGPRNVSWGEVIDRRDQGKPYVYRSDEVRKAGR